MDIYILFARKCAACNINTELFLFYCLLFSLFGEKKQNWTTEFIKLLKNKKAVHTSMQNGQQPLNLNRAPAVDIQLRTVH